MDLEPLYNISNTGTLMRFLSEDKPMRPSSFAEERWTPVAGVPGLFEVWGTIVAIRLGATRAGNRPTVDFLDIIHAPDGASPQGDSNAWCGNTVCLRLDYPIGDRPEGDGWRFVAGSPNQFEAFVSLKAIYLQRQAVSEVSRGEINIAVSGRSLFQIVYSGHHLLLSSAGLLALPSHMTEARANNEN